jgi:hypothetical protein
LAEFFNQIDTRVILTKQSTGGRPGGFFNWMDSSNKNALLELSSTEFATAMSHLSYKMCSIDISEMSCGRREVY